MTPLFNTFTFNQPCALVSGSYHFKDSIGIRSWPMPVLRSEPFQGSTNYFEESLSICDM